jgi:hypothetical protein
MPLFQPEQDKKFSPFAPLPEMARGALCKKISTNHNIMMFSLDRE